MRRAGALGLVLLACFAGVTLVPPAAKAGRLDRERALLRLINAERVERGLVKVRLHRDLDRAALSHSREMLRRDYFAHRSYDGETMPARLRRLGYKRAGWSYWRVGEVIALGSGTRGRPAAVLRAWMKSTAHRAIILKPGWRDVGVGCAIGEYRGVEPVSIYTVDLGRRID